MYLLGSEFTASEVTPLYPILLGERKVLDLMVSGIEKIKENVEEILYAFLKKANIQYFSYKTQLLLQAGL